MSPDLPPAVILDVDDTVVNTSAYQAWTVVNGTVLFGQDLGPLRRGRAGRRHSGRRRFHQIRRQQGREGVLRDQPHRRPGSADQGGDDQDGLPRRRQRRHLSDVQGAARLDQRQGHAPRLHRQELPHPAAVRRQHGRLHRQVHRQRRRPRRGLCRPTWRTGATTGSPFPTRPTARSSRRRSSPTIRSRPTSSARKSSRRCSPGPARRSSGRGRGSPRIAAGRSRAVYWTQLEGSTPISRGLRQITRHGCLLVLGRIRSKRVGDADRGADLELGAFARDVAHGAIEGRPAIVEDDVAALERRADVACGGARSGVRSSWSPPSSRERDGELTTLHNRPTPRNPAAFHRIELMAG